MYISPCAAVVAGTKQRLFCVISRLRATQMSCFLASLLSILRVCLGAFLMIVGALMSLLVVKIVLGRDAVKRTI